MPQAMTRDRPAKRPEMRPRPVAQKGTAFVNPFKITGKERRTARAGFRDEGLRGKELKGAMGGFKKERLGEINEQAGRLVPEQLQGLVNPKKYARKVLQGKEPYGPLKELSGYRAVTDLFGYDQPEAPLRESLMGELEAGAPVNTMRELAPMLGELSGYARTRLGAGGLTPEEEAAIRGPGREAVESSFREGSRGEMSRLAMAGLDPRSGVAADRALQLERARAGGLADVERNVVTQELARRAQLESLAQGVSGMEETGRRFDVEADLSRQRQVERQLGDLARLAEARRTYDIDTAEGQRQAKLARIAYKKAAKSLKPTALEKTGSILGGLFGGVGGGR